MNLLQKLGVDVPIVQAPMAGVSTPALAAAVMNAGALGSIAVGAVTADKARQMLREVRVASDRACMVNVFCHAPAVPDSAINTLWLKALAPTFKQYGAAPPERLAEIYTSFLQDQAMLEMLVSERPQVVSFHFGLPSAAQIAALHAAGIVLFATATSVEEGRVVAAAGIDAVVAQGFEAGGHRGVFDPEAPDAALSTLALTRLLVRALKVPVIAAGGIMDGAGVAAALSLGACAAQMGTAFVGCPESAADAGYREALFGTPTTVMTRVISGRPARCLQNAFTALSIDAEPPDYPVAYAAGKALNAAAKVHGEHGFGAQWAGQGAPLARVMPASDLIATLREELEDSLRVR